MKRLLSLILLSLAGVMSMFALPVDVSAVDSILARHPGGRYIFIPDSLHDEVITLLEGHSKVVDDEDHLDLEELTVHKGDTVNMILKQRNLGRYDRGLFNYLYIPKGQWMFGLTASYAELSTDNLDIFGLVSDVNMGGHQFSIKPYLSYFVKNNLSVGLRFGYTSGSASIDSFGMNVMDGMDFNIRDVGYSNETYTAAVFMDSFVGIARQGRFGVYNEVELAFSSGNSKFTRPYAGEMRNTETTTTRVDLNFSPGLQVFIMKNVSFHVSFGVFGFYLKNEKQKENDVDSGNRFTSGANFRFNLFNINFGIAVNL